MMSKWSHLKLIVMQKMLFSGDNTQHQSGLLNECTIMQWSTWLM